MRLFLPFIAMLVIAACGKTGDLYLPDDKTSVEDSSLGPAASVEK